MLIPKIVGKMKMLTSKKINLHRQTLGTKNWQKDCYDHIVRNETSYWHINDYIINNPTKWDQDKLKK